jgi:hypothetical protein
MGIASMKAKGVRFDMIGYVSDEFPANCMKNKPEPPAPVQEK